MSNNETFYRLSFLKRDPTSLSVASDPAPRETSKFESLVENLRTRQADVPVAGKPNFPVAGKPNFPVADFPQCFFIY